MGFCNGIPGCEFWLGFLMTCTFLRRRFSIRLFGFESSVASLLAMGFGYRVEELAAGTVLSLSRLLAGRAGYVRYLYLLSGLSTFVMAESRSVCWVIDWAIYLEIGMLFHLLLPTQRCMYHQRSFLSRHGRLFSLGSITIYIPVFSTLPHSHSL